MKLSITAIIFIIHFCGLSQIDTIKTQSKELKEIVISGSLKEIKKSESIIPIETISSKFLQKNKSSNLFESLSIINGVIPQINCNVCNTGDIHINGMEGPYTLVLIDGMPIVSGLGSVYGLSGIPTSLIERLEIIKGPASSLYGSDAMGGLVNVITKSIEKAPKLLIDQTTNTWGESNTDLATKFKIKNSIHGYIGINYYNYQFKIDRNNDEFTDLPLQQKLSIFNKWQIKKNENPISEFAIRGVIENRWGGQLNWNEKWAGSDSIYAESIKTKRVEFIMKNYLFSKNLVLQNSYNIHQQESFYGITSFNALQKISFIQLYWNKELHQKIKLLLGVSIKNTQYDDNTPATLNKDGYTNSPTNSTIPGGFSQLELKATTNLSTLIGYRYDYDQHHGNIHSPRVGLKWKLKNNILRYNFGTGFRVVNIFTEDHAALTGARKVIIEEELKPEKSINHVLHFTRNDTLKSMPINIELSLFNTEFSNKIIGDFDSNPDEIRFKNLAGKAYSKGISGNIMIELKNNSKINLGITYMNVFQINNQIKTQQLHAPKFTSTLAYSFQIKKIEFDITGNCYGPMRLPILPKDYRPEYSPIFCILNLQATYKHKNWTYVSGIKNLLNFIPKNPIMRPFDPFDKQINDPINNPQNYTFDPSYNYSSLQGIRLFIGLKYML